MVDFKQLRSLLMSNRTFRRFDSSIKVSKDELLKLVELTRYCASGRNAQPLKYRLVIDTEECARVYETLAWAGYYTDWDGPEPQERPTAYLIQCLDTHFGQNCLCDDGLQLEAITLGARTLGYGCCIIKAFNKPKLTAAVSLPEGLEARYVVAVGKPTEKVEIDDMECSPGASFVYYRDANDVHHVPKRVLSELIIE